jgi:hypothetical protein
VDDRDLKHEANKEERLTTADLAGAGRGREEELGEEFPRADEERVRLEGRPSSPAVSGAAVETNAAAKRTVVSAGNNYANRGASSSGGTAAATARELETGPLFSSDEAKTFRAQWDAIQVGFVDEPRQSVEQADSLVAAAMKRLAEQFSEERSRLEKQWDRGGDVSTEDLRLALRRYRSFFGRLLSV